MTQAIARIVIQDMPEVAGGFPVQNVREERAGFLHMLAGVLHVSRVKQVPRVKHHVPIVLQIPTAAFWTGDSGLIIVIPVVETGLNIIVEWGLAHVLIVEQVYTGQVPHVPIVVLERTADPD